QLHLLCLVPHGANCHDAAQQGQADTQPERKIARSHAGGRTHGIVCCAQGKACSNGEKHYAGPKVLFISNFHVDEVSFVYRYIQSREAVLPPLSVQRGIVGEASRWIRRISLPNHYRSVMMAPGPCTPADGPCASGPMYGEYSAYAQAWLRIFERQTSFVQRHNRLH